jgi:CPA1 family monovalent cation:H+ antiporter
VEYDSTFPGWGENSDMSPTLEIMLSLSFLLLVSTGTFLLSKRFKFPYTVLLVVVGLLLIPL